MEINLLENKDNSNEDNLMSNNNWNLKKEKSLRNTIEQCKVYKWMHGRSTKYYNKLDKLIGIPSIILGAFTGVSTFATLQEKSDCDETSFQTGILIGVIIFISTSLTALQQFLNFSKISERHSAMSKDYSVLINDIKTQLDLEVSERNDAIEFIKNINEKKNSFIVNSPDIPSKVWNHFLKDTAKGILLDDSGHKIILKDDGSVTSGDEKKDVIINVDENENEKSKKSKGKIPDKLYKMWEYQLDRSN